MNQIGIQQGRLSPPSASRLQSFPWQTWQQEFENARQCQIDLIEWLFDADNFEQNPIWKPDGIRDINACVQATGVGVLTCCASYFMAHPFFRVAEHDRRASIQVLNQLILKAVQVDLRTILLPVLEVSEIRTPEEKEQLLESLREPLRLAGDHGIQIGLETELPADEYLALVQAGGSRSLGVYYDTGNNTARGYTISSDARTLAPYLVGVHIKDRKRGGPNVPLGSGDADFDGFFQVMRETGYPGPMIMETIFGPDYLGMAARHMTFVKDHLTRSEASR